MRSFYQKYVSPVLCAPERSGAQWSQQTCVYDQMYDQQQSKTSMKGVAGRALWVQLPTSVIL